jgi:Flp pilus assembly protein CpaB
MGSGAESKTMPILSDVHVVAVGQTYKKTAGQTEAQPTSSVTVEVQPADGGKLINAMAAGKLYCLMRNQSDHAPITVRDISGSLNKKASQSTPSELSVLPTTSLQETKLPPPPPPDSSAAVQDPRHSIQLWSANKKDELTVPKE